MLIGQTIVAGILPAKALYHTPWFPGQSDSLTALVQVMKSSGAFTLTVQMQTKDEEQSDALAVNLGASVNITAVSTTPTPILRSGARELVRYTYTLSSSTTAQWIHLRANPPIWQPN